MARAGPFLLDSDVLIEYLRGRPQTISYLESLAESSSAPLRISVISVAELFAGVKGDRELSDLEVFLNAFEVVPLTPDMGREGGLLRLVYRPGQGLSLADALIAATAQAIGAILVTFNRRHYPMLERVEVPYSRD